MKIIPHAYRFPSYQNRVIFGTWKKVENLLLFFLDKVFLTGYHPLLKRCFGMRTYVKGLLMSLFPVEAAQRHTELR